MIFRCDHCKNPLAMHKTYFTFYTTNREDKGHGWDLTCPVCGVKHYLDAVDKTMNRLQVATPELEISGYQQQPLFMSEKASMEFPKSERAYKECKCDCPLPGPEIFGSGFFLCENCLGFLTQERKHEIEAEYRKWDV